MVVLFFGWFFCLLFLVDLGISRKYLKYAGDIHGLASLSIRDISTILYPPTFSFPYLALLISFTPTSLLLNQNSLSVQCDFTKSLQPKMSMCFFY